MLSESVQMKNRPAVALLIETSNAYARGVLQGVMAYINEHDPWSIHLPEQERGAPPPSWFARWHGDGIIARIETKEIAKALTKTDLPTVDVSAARYVPSIPWVETDDEAIAESAARHLMDRGFRHFGFCGEPRFNWSKWRLEHFVRIIRRYGQNCDVYETPKSTKRRTSPLGEDRRLIDWVQKLPRPIGVMACYDIKAQQLLDACREIDVAVPEEVAVVGVDNDELLCKLSTPPLSSVIPDTRRTGYKAAALLDRMMAGEQISPEAHRIEPLGIATRQSTDTLAIDDTDIAAAVRYIREHACEGINVNDVLKTVPLTRRTLESRFQKILDRTPHEEIIRVKMERVKQLLIETDLKLPKIADRAGFLHVEYMSAAFKKHTGQPPREFRTKADYPAKMTFPNPAGERGGS